MGNVLQAEVTDLQEHSYCSPVPFVEMPTPLDPGDRVGRFVVEESIDGGKQAQVYRSFDVETGTYVALKKQIVKDKADLLRAEQEALITLALSEQGTGTVPFVGEGVGDKKGEKFLYLSTQFMERGSLTQALDIVKPARISQRGLAKVMIPALKGVATVHRAGLVHQDIKPANIYIGKDGQGVIGDFGITNTEPTPDTPVKGMRLRGDIKFMPHEVLLRCKPFTQKGDIFSIGATLFVALTGGIAPWGETANDCHYADAMDNFDPTVSIRSHNKSVSPAFADFISKCLLARDPADRPDIDTTIAEVTKHLKSH